jgi:hypothetical protein
MQGPLGCLLFTVPAPALRESPPIDRLSFRDDYRATIGTLHYRRTLRRRRQACAAGAGNRLYRSAFIFIPPTTLLSNHQLADTGIFGYPGHAGP